MHTGGCLCGGIRFRVQGNLAPIELCHCSQCRKAQGGPFASNIPVAAAAFRITQGHELLAAFASSPGKERVFCKRCGAPILSRRVKLPDMLRVRAGSLDGPVGTRPLSHAFTHDKADWWAIDDQLPQYPGARP
jgi:hypothetical protein